MSLGSGVFLRNQNRAPVASCTAQRAGTGKQIALNGSASEDPEGFNLKEYKWYANGQTTDRRPRRASSRSGTRPPPARTRSGSTVKDQGDLTADGQLPGR